MASITPRIRAAVVPGTGHNIHLESPETYCALLKHFLDARQEQKC
jgi:pimeloyl-ACP methyl ester carboxylesterase